MPLTFDQKLSQTRAYTTLNQLGVDSQEVYNEAILQALDSISPIGTYTNGLTITVATTSGTTIANNVSVAFITSSTFVGTIQGAVIGASTTINISAETGATLQAIPYTITAGSITILVLNRP
jgi:hypothetical protein